MIPDLPHLSRWWALGIIWHVVIERVRLCIDTTLRALSCSADITCMFRKFTPTITGLSRMLVGEGIE
jgi:hypothetical protein